MLQGGRGGEAKLKLYLSTVLLAGGDHKHAKHGANTVSGIASAKWARALAFEDPEGRGARRVADAHNALARQGLVTVTRTPGSDPVVRLLSADGQGRHWKRPTQPYTTVPLGLWRERWIWKLDGKELAILIALLDFLGGRNEDASWMTPEERARFGFSAETWRTATASLVDRGLIESAYVSAESRDFESARRRRTYRVCEETLDPNAAAERRDS
jgi:hypothetical protein